MSRTTRLFATLAAAAAVALGACQGNASPTPPPISVNDLLSRTVASLSGVKTAHIQIDLSGTIKTDLTGGATGSSGGGGTLDLKGTTATLDVDVAGKSAHLTALAPGFLNSGADVIASGGDAYYKITGPFAQSDKYVKVPLTGVVPGASAGASAVPDASAAVSDLQSALASLQPQLSKLPAPVMGAPQACGDSTCYAVTYHVTSADLAAVSSAAPVASIPAGDVTVELLSRVSDYRPAKVTINLNGGDQGTLAVVIGATYDAPVSIAAPSPDQVTEGTGTGLPFPLPSIGTP